MTTVGFHGLLTIDKPSGMTSRDVVNRAQGWFPRRTRIGHTGTLDPLATGVLVICVGNATRLAEYVQQMEKTYRTTIQLGVRSDTDDANGTIQATEFTEPPPSMADVSQCLSEFIGEIEQLPPAYSAAKIEGRRAYALARRGETVTLQPRSVNIHEIEMVKYEYPWLELGVRCGKGTYIRSLARDLGERLGRGGMVQTLRRTSVGHFREQNSLQLDMNVATARAGLVPIAEAVAELPRLEVSETDLNRLRNGQSIDGSVVADGNEVAIFSTEGRLEAIGRMEKERLVPVKVMAHS